MSGAVAAVVATASASPEAPEAPEPCAKPWAGLQLRTDELTSAAEEGGTGALELTAACTCTRELLKCEVMLGGADEIGGGRWCFGEGTVDTWRTRGAEFIPKVRTRPKFLSFQHEVFMTSLSALYSPDFPDLCEP